jgi:colanic acid biosynthesis glycosyl transferase WcaI
MRVLVVGTNYVPERTGMAPFSTGLSEHFAEQGHDVQVITTFPYYPEWRIWDGYRGRLTQKEQNNGVNVRRVWHYVPARASSLVQRLIHDVSFAIHVFLAALFMSKFDIVCCVCPPPTLALTGYLLSIFRRQPYMILLTDLASDAALATGIMREGFAIRMARGLEGFLYRRAENIVCICQGFVEKLTLRGADPDRLVLIPLWGNTDNVYPIEGATKFRIANNFKSSDFLAMYTGNIGKKQDLMNVVRAAELSSHLTDLTWVLVGEGEERTLIGEAIRHRGLTNIRMLPLQPASSLAEMYSAANALFIHQKAAVVDAVIPSKLLTYMAAGRPILAAVSDKSETARYVESANCGLIIHPESPEALVESVLSLRTDSALQSRLGANGRAYVQQHFAKDKVLQKYDLLFSRYKGQGRPDTEASKKTVEAN